MNESTGKWRSIWFYVHLLLVILSWVGPFLISWYLIVPVYLVVIIQFFIFDRCLMNSRHGLHEEEDKTFYSNMFESMGMQTNRKMIKGFVRPYLYIVLSAITLLMQPGLHFKPLWF